MKRVKIIFHLGKEIVKPLPPKGVSSVRMKVDFLNVNNDWRFGLGDIFKQINEKNLPIEMTAVELLLVAVAIFGVDTRINRKDFAQDGWTREIELWLPVIQVNKWKETKTILSTLLRFLTGDLWSINFYKIKKNCLDFKINKSGIKPNFNCVCLFSGGMDSFIGANNLYSEGKRPLLISHWADAINRKVQKDVFSAISNKYSLSNSFHCQCRVSIDGTDFPKSSNEYTQRARSFIFLSLGVLFASALQKSSTLYIPENGLISLNVPLELMRIGAPSTRTTHPFYLARFRELLNILKLNIKIENPYRHMTKGEMLKSAKNKKFLNTNLKNTISCSSPAKSRYKGLTPGIQCGYCIPCIIRRAAFLRAGVIDSTKYVENKIQNRTFEATSVQGENIRPFQLMYSRLKENPILYRTLIYGPGPLIDISSKIECYSNLFKNGMEEVNNLIRSIKVKNV